MAIIASSSRLLPKGVVVTVMKNCVNKDGTKVVISAPDLSDFKIEVNKCSKLSNDDTKKLAKDLEVKMDKVKKDLVLYVKSYLK